MKIIIFSKDRAQQLDFLLSSMNKNWAGFPFADYHIIYTYSNDRFKEGYEILKNKRFGFVMPNFYKERDFNTDLLIYLISEDNYLGFFTDDCVFYRQSELRPHFIENLLADEQNLCVSLRLGRENSLIQNYLTGEIHQKIDTYPFSHVNEYQLTKYRWGLFPSQSNPGYIGSIDGCFYYNQYVMDAIRNVNISCPRALEENLSNNKEWRNKMMSKKPYMICPRHSNVVVNSINAVQTDAVTCGQEFSYDPLTLNEIYLRGEVIDLEDFLEKCENIQGCHCELPLTFRKYE